jgi:CheY-like chemotaxis protein
MAEDEAKVRELAKPLLEGYGYKVIEAVDGEDAVKIFNENKDKITQSPLHPKYFPENTQKFPKNSLTSRVSGG